MILHKEDEVTVGLATENTTHHKSKAENDKINYQSAAIYMAQANGNKRWL